MATAKKTWASEADVYKTDGYSGSDADIDGTERYTSDLDFDNSGANGYEGCVVHVKYDASGTTDDLEVKVYGSIDGTNYDDIPLWSQTFDNNAGAETEVSFIIRDLMHARIGFKRSGSTDTFELDCDIQYWYWTIS